MFKIENVFVDDKKLGDALRALTGIAIEPPVAVPVMNARVMKGKVTAKNNGELVTMYAADLAKHGVKDVSASHVKQWLKENGLTNPYGYLLRKAQDHGVLKKVGKGTDSKYRVIAPLTGPKPVIKKR